MQVQPYLFFEGRTEVPPGSEDKIMHSSFRVGDTVVMASDGRSRGSPVSRAFR